MYIILKGVEAVEDRKIIYECNCPEWDECPKDEQDEDAIECKDCRYSSPYKSTI